MSWNSLAEEELEEELEGTISDYCLVMLQIKDKLGAARMSISTKNLEFIRILYGGPRSQMVVVIMYVCRCYGWAPKYDYAYSVVQGKGGSGIWYCAKCCCKFI